jgi:2-C-methyl-D-erythritol 4-phosphate cytidylyltransferase
MAAEGGLKKPLLELAGRTVLAHACAAFDAAASIKEVILVGAADDLSALQAALEGHPAAGKVRAWVVGGDERTDSVRAGVAAVSDAAEVILVHDVARPLVAPEHIDAVSAQAAAAGAALLAVPVRDTIKESAKGSHAESTLDREKLWAAQTPQGFGAGVLREILARAQADGFRPTDDAALYERYVGPVPLVEGSPENIKLTTRADLVVAAAILRARAEVNS